MVYYITTFSEIEIVYILYCYFHLVTYRESTIRQEQCSECGQETADSLGPEEDSREEVPKINAQVALFLLVCAIIVRGKLFILYPPANVLKLACRLHNRVACADFGRSNRYWKH